MAVAIVSSIPMGHGQEQLHLIQKIQGLELAPSSTVVMDMALGCASRWQITEKQSLDWSNVRQNPPTITGYKLSQSI